MTRIRIMLFIGFVFVTLTGFSQVSYTFKKHELWNLNSNGDKINLKSYPGPSLFESFKIDANFSIEFKYVGGKETYKSRWQDDLVQKKKDSYVYEMLSGVMQKDRSKLTADLIFDTATNKLIGVLWVIEKDNVTVCCFEDTEND